MCHFNGRFVYNQYAFLYIVMDFLSIQLYDYSTGIYTFHYFITYLFMCVYICTYVCIYIYLYFVQSQT